MTKPTQRFMALEGLRGVAALMVVVYHFIALFFPAMRNGNMDLAHTRYEQHLYGTPVTLFFSGGLGVAIFFVLSGFVLSIGFFRTGNQSIVVKLATGRYLRLMIPALASVLLAWIIIQFGAHELTNAAGQLGNSEELARKWSKNPSLFEVIKAGVYDICVEYKPKSRAVNHPLWTMHVEFVGSFIVFGFLLLFARSRYRWISYLALVLAFVDTWYLGFIIGVAIADAYNLGWFEKLKRWYFTVPVFAIAIALAMYSKKNVDETLYRYLDLSHFGVRERDLYLTLSAVLIMLVVLLSKWVGGFLGTRFMAALGRYTFSLYLTHVFVIYTVASAVVIWLAEPLGYGKAVGVAALISAPVFWIVSYLFERYVDAPSIRIAKYVGSLYRGEHALNRPKFMRPIGSQTQPEPPSQE